MQRVNFKSRRFGGRLKLIKKQSGKTRMKSKEQNPDDCSAHLFICPLLNKRQSDPCYYLIANIMSEAMSQKQKIKASFINSVNQIKQEYTTRITNLQNSLKNCCSKLQQVQSQLDCKNRDLMTLSKERNKLKEEVQRLENLVLNLERTNESIMDTSREQIEKKDKIIEELKREARQLQDQLKVIKNMDVMSLDQSSVCMQEYSRQQFSLEISELFKNSPGQILRFLDSIDGELSPNPKQQGDMTCMFVSKDSMSLEKYININRSFLKRKIKEHEPRFRFVLIHKPDQV